MSETNKLQPDLNHDTGCYEHCMSAFGCCLGVIGMSLCCCCSPYKSVQEGFKGLVTQYGRFTEEKAPGVHYINPATQGLIMVDMRLQVKDLSRQNVMTRDNVTINIDCVLGYRITDAYKAKFAVQDIDNTVSLLTYTTLRDVIGTKDLQVCLTDREGIAQEVKNHVAQPADDMGCHIESMKFKDITIPTETQDALSAAAIAQRTAAAKVISAEGDVRSAELMRKAADILDSPAAMQIRYLETISNLAHSNNAKIIFLPADYGKGSNKKLLDMQLATQSN